MIRLNLGRIERGENSMADEKDINSVAALSEIISEL